MVSNNTSPIARQPLSKSQLQQLHETAHNNSGINKRHIFLPVDIIPYSGLYPAEFCHLTEDWITFPEDINLDPEDPIFIRIPESQECPQIRLDYGSVEKTDEPCPHCRKTKGPDRWERRFKTRDRIIEVMADPAREALRSWFNLYDAIPHSVPSLSENITKLAKEAELERKVTATALRKTYALMLVKMGFPIDYVVETGGYSIKGRLPDEALDAHRQQTSTTPRTMWPTTQLLNYLAANGPAATSAIQSDLEWHNSTLRQHLRTLQGLGIVTQPSKSGRSKLWNYNGDPVDTLNCVVEECSRTFDTLKSLSLHLGRSHPDFDRSTVG